MGVVEVHGQSDFNAKLRGAGGKLVVVDFTATWCGPCQMIKPTFHQWANELQDVVFLEVNEANNDDVIHSIGIRGFPTFHLYINSQKVDELVGADVNSLRRKIDTWRASAGYNPFASEGVTLGSGGIDRLCLSKQPTTGVMVGATWEDPRDARLRKFNQDASAALRNVAAPVAAPPTLTDEDEQKEDDELVKALLLSQQELKDAQADQAATSSETSHLEIPPVNAAFLEQSLLATTDQMSLEAAISWIAEHQEDADIDAPIQFIDLAKQRKELTTEEKQAKVAELKRRIDEKKAQRAAQAKKDDVAREIARRNMGKDMASAREEYDAIQTRLVREKQAREKAEAKRERERLLKQIELDKAERRARKLAATTSLDAPERVSTTDVAAPSPGKPAATPEMQMQTSIDRLSQYRVGNDGLTALKTLLVYVTNVLDKPTELDKYGKINSANPAFKKRVGSFIGGLSFLRAIGFEKDQDGDLFVLHEPNEPRLRDAKLRLQKAIDAFPQ
ncbi:hypothetical protein DYB30_008672 [Aphanomyces astaci]|uniref:Thioredoxin domain-containing protein n=4 Tax=Aphanomyces astaci TaxID=112090 RepID=A0A397CFP0_APHAT|nr:hypothetical protein DYB30_008672 [Aphanomyces astaci]